MGNNKPKAFKISIVARTRKKKRKLYTNHFKMVMSKSKIKIKIYFITFCHFIWQILNSIHFNFFPHFYFFVVVVPFHFRIKQSKRHIMTYGSFFFFFFCSFSFAPSVTPHSKKRVCGVKSLGFMFTESNWDNITCFCITSHTYL